MVNPKLKKKLFRERIRRRKAEVDIHSLKNVLVEKDKHIKTSAKRNIIEKTNLKYLLYTTKELTELDSPGAMLDLILERLGRIMAPWGFGVIIEASRSSIIDYKAFYNLDKYDQAQIVQKHDCITMRVSASNLGEERDGEVTFLIAEPDDTKDNEYTSSKVRDIVYGGDKVAVSKLLGAKEPWEWLVLDGNIGTNHSLLLFIKGQNIDNEAISTIRLFTSLVSSLVTNQLLKQDLRRLANTDHLTSLSNRKEADEVLAKQINLASIEPITHFSLIAIDINGLKRVNDVFGHSMGDEMLVKCAAIIKNCCRSTDTVSRQGGDEFLVICPNTDHIQVKILIDRIRASEKGASVTCAYEDSGKEEVIPIRLSIGYASSKEAPPKEVYDLADKRETLDKENYYKIHNKYR